MTATRITTKDASLDPLPHSSKTGATGGITGISYMRVDECASKSLSQPVDGMLTKMGP